MTPGARRVLEKLAADEDCDLVQEGILVYCGDNPTTGKVVKELLNTMAIKVTSKDGMMGSITYFGINDTGRALLRRPELEGELAKAISAKKRRAFQIINDRIRFLK